VTATRKPRSEWRTPSPERRARGRVKAAVAVGLAAGESPKPAAFTMRRNGVTVRFKHARREQVLGWDALAGLALRLEAEAADTERKRLAEDAAQLKFLYDTNQA